MSRVRCVRCSLGEAFRQAARVDRKARLVTHLRSLGVEGTPARLLEGTIEFVRMAATFGPWTAVHWRRC